MSNNKRNNNVLAVANNYGAAANSSEYVEAPMNEYSAPNFASSDEIAEEYVPNNMNGAGRKRRRASRKASRKVGRKASRKVGRKASRKVGRKASRKVGRKASRKASRKSRKALRK